MNKEEEEKAFSKTDVQISKVFLIWLVFSIFLSIFPISLLESTSENPVFIVCTYLLLTGFTSVLLSVASQTGPEYSTFLKQIDQILEGQELEAWVKRK